MRIHKGAIRPVVMYRTETMCITRQRQWKSGKDWERKVVRCIYVLRRVHRRGLECIRWSGHLFIHTKERKKLQKSWSGSQKEWADDDAQEQDTEINSCWVWRGWESRSREINVMIGTLTYLVFNPKFGVEHLAQERDKLQEILYRASVDTNLQTT